LAVKKGEGSHAVNFVRVTIPRWGENITGWLTRPTDTPRPGVIVVPDVWGITGSVEMFCHRLSRNGYVCLAVEPYTRVPRPVRVAPFEDVRTAYQQLSPRTMVGDLRAGLDFLRLADDVFPERIGVIGIGEGGRAALELAADPDLKVRSLALFYSPVTADSTVSAPVLGLFGADDDVVAADDARAFGTALAAGGGRPEILVYPGAKRGFIDDERDTYSDAAAAEASTRLLAFLDRTLA
jgi:carboxymethylenebutenolidase